MYTTLVILPIFIELYIGSIFARKSLIYIYIYTATYKISKHYTVRTYNMLHASTLN